MIVDDRRRSMRLAGRNGQPVAAELAAHRSKSDAKRFLLSFHIDAET
jgi:cytidylate kinase